MLRFWDEQAPFWGKNGSICGGNWFGFWIGLGQNSSLTVLNAKHVWVWVFEVLGLGVSKNKPVGNWEGKMLKPLNVDVENWVLLR